MKTGYRYTIADGAKSKKKKRVAKNLSSASIAQRYMELRRLRERISEAEAGGVTREFRS